MSSDSNLRVGAVSYLNTRPLVYGLAEAAPWITLEFDFPSRLAAGLAAGRYDVALIPSIEFFQDPRYTLVSDACIACRGPVWSVKMFFRVPPPQVQRLALDEGSRTSAALAQVLLAERYGLRPHLENLPLNCGLADTEADAVLLIGDRAMHGAPGPFAEVWDLGEEWLKETGLPFVFAMWVARPGAPTGMLGGALAPILSQVRDAGVDAIPQIAHREAAPLGLAHGECVRYLRDHLHFTLGPAELSGLARFHSLAQELNLIPSGACLDLSPCGN